MSALDVAQEIIDTVRPGQRAASIEPRLERDHPLERIIVLEGGERCRVTGAWARQLDQAENTLDAP